MARDPDAELRPIRKPIAALDFRVIFFPQKLQAIISVIDKSLTQDRFGKTLANPVTRSEG
jgi:hypothetical protein